MAGEWLEKAIGEIADVIGGSTPPTRDSANFGGQVPWLTPKDLAGPHPRYVERGARNLSEQGLMNCSAQMLPANSVLLSTRAPIGYVAIAANPVTTNQGFRSLVVKPSHHHEFVYYWLMQNVDELERHVSGSTFKELSGSSLKSIRLRLPASSSERRAIAEILGSLDDKIELNRHMSETLEALATTLFHGWFIDKVALPDWANPESWCRVPLGAIVIEQEQKMDPLQAPDTVFEHYSLPAFDTGVGPALEVGQSIKSIKTRVPVGSILVSRLNPRIPRVWLTDVDSPDRAIASTEFLVLSPRPSVGRAFSYLAVSSPAFQQKLISMATGTSGSHQRVRPAAAWKRPPTPRSSPSSSSATARCRATRPSTRPTRRRSGWCWPSASEVVRPRRRDAARVDVPTRSVIDDGERPSW